MPIFYLVLLFCLLFSKGRQIDVGQKQQNKNTLSAMEEYIKIPDLPGYVSVKDAAKMLGLADKTVYEYVAEGRIPAVRAANVIMIPIEEVRKFRPNIAGRPRKNIPIWRIPPSDNRLLSTLITLHVELEKRAAFLKRLEDIRRERSYLFPGTIARYILDSDQDVEKIQLLLIWRGTTIPNEDERKRYLEEFITMFSDIVDGGSIYFETGCVLMHA